jgi:hypothetical protein
MTKIAAVAVALAIGFAPVAYAADTKPAEAPKTEKLCKKAKGKWDAKAKKCELPAPAAPAADKKK